VIFIVLSLWHNLFIYSCYILFLFVHHTALYATDDPRSNLVHKTFHAATSHRSYIWRCHLPQDVCYSQNGVLCNSGLECLPGASSKYFWNDLGGLLFCVIIDITFTFLCDMRYTSVSKSWYCVSSLNFIRCNRTVNPQILSFSI
jgi:hypothetical protein